MASRARSSRCVGPRSRQVSPSRSRMLRWSGSSERPPALPCCVGSVATDAGTVCSESSPNCGMPGAAEFPTIELLQPEDVEVAPKGGAARNGRRPRACVPGGTPESEGQ